MKRKNNRSALEMSGFKMQNKGISDKLQTTTVSAIKEMMHLAQDYPKAVSLGQGTPSFLTPAHIRDRVKQELDQNPDIGKYAPLAGLPKLKQAIAKKLKQSRNIAANPETEIYITSGAMEAIFTAVFTVLNPQDELILFTPCFPSHIIQTRLAQGVPVCSPLVEEENWALNLDDFKAKISKKTKAVILCNPSNPTGTVFSKQEIEQIAQLAQKHDFWIITDEPYDFLVYDDQEFFSASQLPEIKDRLISCFTFSKEYAMTGFRVGYVYTTASVVNQMLKVHDAFNVTATTVSQYAALAALEGSQKSVLYFKKEFAKRRELIYQHLLKLENLFETKKPGGAYYIFPKIKPNIDDYDLAIRLLKEAKVIVVPGSAFGEIGKGHLRLSYAQSEDDINTAFKRIGKWWKENQNQIKI